MKAMRAKSKHKEDVVSQLCYEGLRDEALEMARVLREIDDELIEAAQFEGDHVGGYPAKDLLPKLCKIMYSCYVNFRHDKFFAVPPALEKKLKEAKDIKLKQKKGKKQ